MAETECKITYIGGPTALIEFGGVRLLTDPGFDPPGGEYVAGQVTLHKTAGPALAPDAIGNVDAVLLSHDHHFDNLDHSGRAFLPHAGLVVTTKEGAERLGGKACGLRAWQVIDVPAPGNRVLRIAATPARHGPQGADRGPCIGFVLAFADEPDRAIYVSGDTVWYEGTAEVASRFTIRIAVLFAGAARVVAPAFEHVTMTAAEAVEAARAFPNATIVPVHHEGWKHFSESAADLIRSFTQAGLLPRLRIVEKGQTAVL